MAPKVLAAVYSGFEDLRRGRVVAFISLVPCKLHSFIPMLHFTIFCYERQLLGTKWSLNGWRKQTNKQQHLYYNRSRWQAAGKSAWCNKKKKKGKKKDPVAVESAHSTKCKENSSSRITQQLPLQFIKRCHRKAWKTACPSLWNPNSIFGISGREGEKYTQKTEK